MRLVIPFWYFLIERGIAIFGFEVLAIFLNRFLGFVPKNFGVHFGLRIFRFLAFGLHFSSKLPNGFRFFLIEFRLLFDLSGNYAPPLISNSCETFVRSKSLFTPLATTASDRLITGMWKVIGFDGSECGFRFDRIFWRFCGINDFFYAGFCGF